MKRLQMTMLLVLLTGCAGTTSIQHLLEDQKGPMRYVHDSVRIENKKAGTVSIGSYSVGDILDHDTIVKNKSSSVLPLVVFNSWGQEDHARLGYSQLTNDYKQFLRESLIEEVKRSSIYALRDDSSTLVLDVAIKKVEMSAPVRQKGYFFFFLIIFGGGSQTTAGPVDVTVAADVRASRDGIAVFAKELQGRFRTNMLQGRNAILQDYTNTMIEGLSMAVKDLNERIVQEINGI